MRKIIILGLAILFFGGCSTAENSKKEASVKKKLAIINSEVHTDKVIVTIKNNTDRSLFYDSPKDRLEINEKGEWKNLTLGFTDIGMNIEIPSGNSEKTNFNLSGYSLEKGKQYRIVYLFNKDKYDETDTVEAYFEFKL